MSLKKNFKKFLKDPSQRVEVFYLSTKIVFSLHTFLFFLAYFFVSAGFFDETLYTALLPLYISFVLSFALFLSAVGIKCFHKKLPFVVSIGLCVLAAIIAGVLLIPVL